ncbi:Protein of unknown function DUF1376 [uncultured Caudovirales phage]|uniref:Lin1244/Lin1753-like N-terminal domain-containing protein n=1 Tax=uncultured Caudovirales phage TaxID=2100421 RepID=A0A6J5TAT7_9CAUD|nr:Protein of unknown function DUF1376 [uncultured Caudovirales phage]CAB4242094.1 Protein of unknown function DUF1376 [uncultured Caudovirales phage]
MHYYQFNIADYRADTAHLSIIEHGIYRQLMDWYYLDEKPIPKETQVVMRRLSLGSDQVHYLTNVLNDFFLLTDSGYFHNRIAIELERYQVQFAKNRVNGQKGGRPSKPIESGTKTQVVFENNPIVTENNPSAPLTNNHKPITINHKPLKPYTPIGQKSALEGFEAFWEIYPKKVGKGAARKIWEKSRPMLSTVLLALQWQIESAQWRKNNGQFIPNPATYLNQERWQDSPDKEVLF